jgi:hypothetical protein
MENSCLMAPGQVQLREWGGGRIKRRTKQTKLHKELSNAREIVRSIIGTLGRRIERNQSYNLLSKISDSTTK